MLGVALSFGIDTPDNKRGPYRKALEAVNLQPVENARALARLDGLLLAGGFDVDPELYGARTQPETGRVDRERDEREAALLHEALERDIPVLAICRGLQLMNAALGGTLIQHIEGHRCLDSQEVHAVRIAAGSRLRSILGVDDYVVNSRHHQAVGRVASALVVTARSPENVVEALELPGKRFVLAVQWHPEERTDGPDARLFAAFREAAATVTCERTR
jgi:gamma-glutamyl-gamma-aminobutyrate hydrolase PuuD